MCVHVCGCDPVYIVQDVSGMTEEQQLALALQMSMQGAGMETVSGLLEQAMETDGVEEGAEEEVCACSEQYSTHYISYVLGHVYSK